MVPEDGFAPTKGLHPARYELASFGCLDIPGKDVEFISAKSSMKIT